MLTDSLKQGHKEDDETTRLLPKTSDTVKKRQTNSTLSNLWNQIYPYSYRDETLAILHLHIPTFFTCFFQFFLQTVSVIMCGHLSKEELDAATLANSLINVVGFGIGLGISTACDTFFSQTFGSHNKKRMGIYLQRSLFVMYMALVLVYCLHMNIRPILLGIGQDPLISDMTATYILYFMPGIFFDFTFLVLARYLQNQNVVYPPLFCAIAGNVFNVISQYLAIYQFGMTYLASAIFQATSVFVMMTLVISYIYFSKVYKDTWDGWKKEALYDIMDFIKLAIPGLFLVFLESLSFELSTIISGLINTVQLGAQGILFQCGTLTFLISLAMSISVSIRIGHQLGSGNPLGARHSCRVAVSLTVIIGLLLVVLYSGLYNTIPGWFTNDEDVKADAALLFQVFAPFAMLGAMSAVLSGVLKGCGKQLLGAIGNLIAYDFVTIPIGIPLSLLTPLQIRGYWLALMFGVFIEIIIFSIIIYRLDWEQESINAHQRTRGLSQTISDAVETAKSKTLIGTRSHNSSISLSDHFEVKYKIHAGAFKPTLIKRILLWTILLGILAAAIFIRLQQEAMTFPCTTNCSSFLNVTNVTM